MPKTTKKAPAKARAAKTIPAPKTPAVTEAAPPQAPHSTPFMHRPADLSIASLKASPLNPRRSMEPESLAELANSIVENGILQPLLVRPSDGGGEAIVTANTVWDKDWPDFEIICGARRFSAAKLAYDDGRLPESFRIPVRIRHCSDAELVLLAATENLARADMEPLDEAALFQTLRDYVTPEKPGELVEAAIGRKLGISERTVFRRLALLRLTPELQEDLRQRKINLQQAGALALGGPDRQAEQRRLFGQGDYYTRPDNIRHAMIQGAIPESRAIFPLDLYTGEWFADPETGVRHFVDEEQFKTLQKGALEGAAEDLRERWPWVAMVDWNDAWKYQQVKETDQAAGAICWLDQVGNFQTRSPVITPGEKAAREKQSARDQGLGRAPDDHSRKMETNQRLMEGLRRAVAGSPKDAFVVDLIVSIGDEICNDDDLATIDRALFPLADRMAAGLELPEDKTLGEVLPNLDPAQAAKLFKALRDAPLADLVALHAAVRSDSLARAMIDWPDKVTPLAEAFAEPGLFDGLAEGHPVAGEAAQ